MLSRSTDVKTNARIALEHRISDQPNRFKHKCRNVNTNTKDFFFFVFSPLVQIRLQETYEEIIKFIGHGKTFLHEEKKDTFHFELIVVHVAVFPKWHYTVLYSMASLA